MPTRFLLLLICSLWVLSSEAASIYKKSLDQKRGDYIAEGVYIGGRTGRGYSLINVRRHFSKDKSVERIVLDIGDLKGEPVRNEVNFFHVSVDRDLARVVIDLSQVARSGVDQNKLAQIFKKSPLVKSAEITFDPEDVSTNLNLQLKKPALVEVFELKSTESPSRIVIDMKPAKG